MSYADLAPRKAGGVTVKIPARGLRPKAEEAPSFAPPIMPSGAGKGRAVAAEKAEPPLAGKGKAPGNQGMKVRG